ncbi:30S ribosomal protein S17 [Candidatus Riesia sp. GBBU]|nr:30S ribosomal protein S17 [Candidatus Riesia sp. GBBU]
MKKKRKVFQGKVISDKMEKSVIVLTSKLKKHSKYGKFILRNKKFFVHDEKNQCKIGDFIEIQETRPISKKKHWKVVKVIKKNNFYFK